MLVNLKSIALEAGNSYRVELEDTTGATRVFILEVQEGGIQVVTWLDDLSLYMGQNMGPASPLFEAVLKFHQAQRMDVSDP
jgi:hypothetical protein